MKNVAWAKPYLRYGFAVLVVGLCIWSVTTEEPLDWSFRVAKQENTVGESPVFKTILDYVSTSGTAHSPAVALDGDGFDILWFDGIRESHNDVVIKSARFSQYEGNWRSTATRDLLSRQTVTDIIRPAQIVLTLGNTVQFARDTTSYLATIVSLGGWAMSSIALVESADNNITTARKLPLSPFLNRSHLVRSPTIRFTNGDIGIPAYFELGNAFGELVRVSPGGRVLSKSRISSGRLGIQPVIVPWSPREAVALMRNFDKKTDRLVASWSEDGGKSWTKPVLLDVPNPNSPVAALLLSDMRILMVFNDSSVHSKSLTLALSTNGGQTWERKHVLEDYENQSGTDVRYPTLARLTDGTILLTYSHGSKRGIRAHVFNEAWIDQLP